MKKPIVTISIMLGLISLTACNRESPPEITTSVSDEPSNEIIQHHKIKSDNKLTEKAEKKIAAVKERVKSSETVVESETVTTEAPTTEAPAIESSEEAVTEAPLIEAPIQEAPAEPLPEQTYPAEQQPVTQEPPTEQATDIPVTEEITDPAVSDSAETLPAESTETVQ